MDDNNKVCLPQDQSERAQSNLGSRVNPLMKVVKESPLCREGSDGDDTLQQLPEIGKDGRSRVGLHSSQVTASIQVAYC